MAHLSPVIKNFAMKCVKLKAENDVLHKENDLMHYALHQICNELQRLKEEDRERFLKLMNER